MRSKNNFFDRRKKRVRFAIRKKNRSEKPRLSIFRSNTHIYAQIIDDSLGNTLISASSNEKNILIKGTNINKAAIIGKSIAEKAKKIGIKSVVFDRGGYLFHGRIKSLADAARKSGLIF